MSRKNYCTGMLCRVCSGVFGLFLLGLGLYVLVSEQLVSGVLHYGFSLVLLVLGGNALYSAWQGKDAWLIKIGPLP